MIKKLISTGKGKIILLSAVIFSMVIVTLGFTPNYSCGCGGEMQNGSKLTYYINGASKIVIGRKILKTKSN